MITTNEDTFLKCITDQTKNLPKSEVFVIEVESVPLTKFTKKIQEILEQFNCLQMLTLNNCGIESLQYFPRITSLIRVDLISNKIVGSELSGITHLKYLQNLNLSNNKISSIADISPLKSLNNLMNLDLLYNPISRMTNYRDTILNEFPKLSILDGVNRKGENFNAISTMDECVKRVRSDLFEKKNLKPIFQNPVNNLVPILYSNPPASSLFGNMNGSLFPNFQSTNLFNNGISSISNPLINANGAINAGCTSLFFGSTNGNAIQLPQTPRISKVVPKRKSNRTNAKAGISFSIPKVKREMKGLTNNMKMKKDASVFTAAVLESVISELIHISALETKENFRYIIQPRDILNAIKNDYEMEYLVKEGVIELEDEDFSNSSTPIKKNKQIGKKTKNSIQRKLRPRNKISS